MSGGKLSKRTKRLGLAVLSPIIWWLIGFPACVVMDRHHLEGTVPVLFAIICGAGQPIMGILIFVSIICFVLFIFSETEDRK